MVINSRGSMIKKCNFHIWSYTFFIKKNPSIFNIYYFDKKEIAIILLLATKS